MPCSHYCHQISQIIVQSNTEWSCSGHPLNAELLSVHLPVFRAVVTGQIGRVSTRLLFEAIPELDGAPSTLVGSHVATLDRARDQWLQIVWKRHFLVFKARRPILITQKWRWKFFPHFTRNDQHYPPLCHCLRQHHPPTATYHFKSHG